MAAATAASGGGSATPSRHFGVKRIMKEYAEFEKEAGSNDYFTAKPCEDNLFEWHFTIRGPPDSDFQGGRYHGRILLPSEYPFKPPDIVMLTPSGRFETHKKICLSISSFHPKNWQPSWSIRTVLTALIAFFPTPGNGAIGSLEYSAHERREYARRSGAFACELCGGKTNLEMLPDLPEGEAERAAGKTRAAPTLAKEVLDTIQQNKDIPALTAASAAAQAGTASSQPGTPAQPRPLGAVAPPTPMHLSQAQCIAAAMPSGPTSPLLHRTYSAPVPLPEGQEQPLVGEGTMLLPPPSASQLANAAAAGSAAPTPLIGSVASSPAASTSAGVSSQLSPLHLDEGLRQRQGRVTLETLPEAQQQQLQAAVPAVAAAAQPAAPPAEAPAMQQQAAAVAVPVRAAAPLSSVTVFLSFLILLILARKLWGSVNRQTEFGLDFP